MYRKIFSLLFIAALSINNLKAQEMVQSGRMFDDFFTFAWDVNIPMGDKYVDAVSYSGAKLEYRKMIDEHMSIGLDISWNSYYEYKPYQTYHIDANTDITTDLYKYNYTLPLSLTADYYFFNGGKITPYIGLGMGALYSSPRLYFNIYQLDDENWGFLMRPEVGAIIKFHQEAGVGILLAARYSLSTNSEPTYRIDNLQALGFQLGIAWTY